MDAKGLGRVHNRGRNGGWAWGVGTRNDGWAWGIGTRNDGWAWGIGTRNDGGALGYYPGRFRIRIEPQFSR
ncbi:hypothetical protein [Halostella sp. PRR32]|uniref:hypothetical protein n=1 Tax=Halostella sp. PRR32 TaxID=3098147 RepID=UPI002B1D4D98|nr:hypothetical protein [Halostella sp. PRR32]